jgi:hypothetical protein
MMPAVNPTRLNFQIANLLQESFHSPEAFKKKLNDLFSLYANRILRYGEEAGNVPLIPMYHLPDPVMRQLQSELKPAISEEPEAALVLADTLWGDKMFETRQVGIFILGHAAVEAPNPILSRLNTWLSPDLEPILKESLLLNGTRYLQSKFAKAWESWIESRLSQKEPGWISIGLMALRASLHSSSSQKLPAIFRLVSPFIRDPQPGTMNELNRLIKILAEKSPTETAYFLRQSLSLSDSPTTSRLIRGCLSSFPDEIQKELQTALRTS